MQLNRLHKLLFLLAALQATPLAAQDSSRAVVAITDTAKDVKESNCKRRMRCVRPKLH